MPLGESTREMFLSIGIAQAFAMCHKAAQACGSVEESNAVLNAMTVKTRYFLQSVRLRIGLRPHEGGTMLTIQGASDDVWGGGARKGIDKFVEALSQQSQKP